MFLLLEAPSVFFLWFLSFVSVVSFPTLLLAAIPFTIELDLLDCTGESFLPANFSERLLSLVPDWTLLLLELLLLLLLVELVFDFFSVSVEQTLELSEEDRFCSDRLVFATVDSWPELSSNFRFLAASGQPATLCSMQKKQKCMQMYAINNIMQRVSLKQRFSSELPLEDLRCTGEIFRSFDEILLSERSTLK